MERKTTKHHIGVENDCVKIVGDPLKIRESQNQAIAALEEGDHTIDSAFENRISFEL